MAALFSRLVSVCSTVSIAALKNPVKATRYSLIGVYADGQLHRFVRHAALLKELTEIATPSSVGVLHIGPPIVASRVSTEVQCRADVLGDIRLSNAECEAVDDFLAAVVKENRVPVKVFQQYIIMPHMRWTVSEEGRRIRRRFSCVGFVIEAYREAGVDLLDIERLPPADEPVLREVYSELSDIEKTDPRVQHRLGFFGRDDLGIPGPGPWPIALPGYVFHSTARISSSRKKLAPYRPQTVREAAFPLDKE